MEDSHRQPIAVIGAGSWGTALALHLAKSGQAVRLWTFESDHAAMMADERINNRFMPGYKFPPSLDAIVDLQAVVADCPDILIAVPSIGFRDTLKSLKPLLTPASRICWATKGLDAESGHLLHEVAQSILGKTYSYAVLSGPSFAKEVAAGLPTAVVIASQHPDFAKDLVARFNSGLFRVYSSTDITGVEIGGIVKNVLAIATGISDGMGFGANARCALITRGLAEMVRLGTSMGGKLETFMGLTGLGDLILTCTDDQSRNRRFGLALGNGKTPAIAQQEIGQIIEGKDNAELIVKLAQKQKIDMPLTNAVWDILIGKLTAKDAMEYLFSRETKQESQYT